MRLDNFLKYAGPTITARGKTYYKSGAVTDVDVNDGEVSAWVAGSKKYHVGMHIKGGKITSYTCTCPYDWGRVCKHEVAVVLYLREHFPELMNVGKKEQKAEEPTDMLTNNTDMVSNAEPIQPTLPLDGEQPQAKLYDPQLKTRKSGFRLPDEMFEMLPSGEFAMHLLALHLIYGIKLDAGYISRIAKQHKHDSSETWAKINALKNGGWLISVNLFNGRSTHILDPQYIFPLAAYIFDRRPEWLAQELLSMPNVFYTDIIFWNINAALYDGEVEYLKRQQPMFKWNSEQKEGLFVVLQNEYYKPLIYTISSDYLLDMASNRMTHLFYNEKLTKEELEYLDSVLAMRGLQNEPAYSDIRDMYQYFAFAIPPQAILPHSTMWAYISNAVYQLYEGNLNKAGEYFEQALIRNNGVSKVKNMFRDMIANYYLMIYYALRNDEVGRVKAEQFQKKELARDILQLPAYIVARFIVTNQEEEGYAMYVNRLFDYSTPIFTTFGSLFAEYFGLLPKGKARETSIILLKDEKLLYSIKRKQPWELALDKLIRGGAEDASDTMPKQHERIVYVIEGRGASKRINPYKQKWLKSNRWGKPSFISEYRFDEDFLDCMDELDKQISHSIERSRYWNESNLGDYLPLLVGSDRVLREVKDNYLPVTVRQEKAFLTIDRRKNSLSFSSNVKVDKERPLTNSCIIEESQTSFVVISLIKYEQQVIQTLLSLGSMPLEAEEQLRQFISVAGNSIEIHSDMIEGGSTLEKVEADSTIILRISPTKDVFEVECCVQPLQGGKLIFFPATGKRTIYDEKDGVRYQVERDLQAEKTKLDRLNDCLFRGSSFTINEHENEFSVEDILALLEIVRDNDDYVIEWLNGAKLQLHKPQDADSCSLGLTTKQNWFEVEGELHLDEKTILSIADLLRLMRNGMVGKRFVRLSDSEYIALGEQLAKHLNNLDQLAQIDKHNVRIPKYEIGLLGELISKSNGILRGDKGIDNLMKRIQKANEMTIVVPHTLQATLRDYQVEGYEWMTRLAEWGAGACLADDMGLGKTIQAIAFMLNRAEQGPSLVVAPASVVYNWQQELLRFAPTLNVFILNEADDRKAVIETVGNYDILLTTYGLLVREEANLADKQWNVVCLDEAHAIKNRATKMSQAAMRLQSKTRLAMTGTPLQNYLSELWNLFQFINPGLLGSYDTFSQNFIVPIESSHDKQRQTLLRKMLQPFLLRRTKAEVVDELPEKTDIIRRIQLSGSERTQYEAIRIDAEQQLENADKVDMNILASITRLRQAACSMTLVGGVGSGKQTKTFGEANKSLQHLEDGYGSKLEDLRELITQIVEGGNRVLVFSQFTSFLKMAEQCVLEYVSKQSMPAPLTTLYLDGSTTIAKRKQIVEQFQRGDAQVFFISLKAGGLGLNLTAANYVIHLDPWWNPAIEQQATDRAYRIGQHQNVTVYHLIAADTIEEKILRLHKSKRNLADALLQDQNTARGFNLDDMRMLVANK